MYWSVFSFLILLTLPNLSFGQITVEGKIHDSATQEPVPYANIGIANSSIGTISNTDGSFSIEIPEKFLNDTLLCSALGFGKKKLPIRLLGHKTIINIYLSEKITILKPVTISAKKEKSRTYGTTASSKATGRKPTLARSWLGAR